MSDKLNDIQKAKLEAHGLDNGNAMYLMPNELRYWIALSEASEADNTALHKRVEGLTVQINDGDVWLIFPDATISIEGICRFGAPGPIVKRNLRKWRDKVLAAAEEGNDRLSNMRSRA